jgi:hypothetical protein
MPTGPKGQKRPADVIGNAVRVAQIATGEAEEEFHGKPELRPRWRVASRIACGRWRTSSGWLTLLRWRV